METAFLQTRQSIWLALSEFYLDTDLDDSDFVRIAAIFKQSGLSLDELKEIDLYEVFPLLGGNLSGTAGSWAGFDEVWLFSGCQKLCAKRNTKVHRWFVRIRNKMHYWMRSRYWEAVERKMD